MKDLNKKKYVFQTLSFLVFVFCSLLLGSRARASEQIMAYQPKFGIGTGCAQTFLATSSNISSISIYKGGVLGTTTYVMLLCFGTYDTGVSYQINKKCLGYQQIIKASSSPKTVFPTIYYTWFNFDIPDTKVASGSTYFFSLDTDSDKSQSTTYNYGRCDSDNTNPYPYGNLFILPVGNFDNTFRIYYETNYVEPPELPPDYYYNGEPQYEADKSLLKWRSDINTVAYQICFINENCNLWFSFNQQAINDKVNLLYSDILPHNPTKSIATTTITATPVWQNKINVPIMTTAGARKYCLYLQDAEFGDLLNCGIEINWVSTSTFEDILGIPGIITYENVCDSIATSSGSILDDIRFAIECGFRRLNLWAFKPSPDALKTFSNNYSLLKRAFPFNIYFDLTDIVSTAVSTTTTNFDDSFKIPFIEKNTAEFYMLPIISSSSMANAIGQNNADTFRSTIGYFLYILTAGAIFFIII